MKNKNLEMFAKMLAEEIKKNPEPVVQQETMLSPIPETKQAVAPTNSVNNYLSHLSESNIEKNRWEDPLTPPDKKFVTVQEMNEHYGTFLKRIQQQLSSLGGGGEVNFRYLDDTNRSTMTPTNDNWVLEYDANSKKVQFTDKIGPISHVSYDTDHVSGDELPGTVCWNKDDQTLNLFHPNGVVQQIGQELYGYVRNNTGSTIPNGTVVQFAGAEQNGTSRLEIAPFLADGTYPSLYTLGVTTEDIIDGADGRVTVWGKVRDVDASGDNVDPAETWLVGDILYAHPTDIGKLTNVKPTSPNNVVPIAAVLNNGTNGEIFVRPTIEQRYDYATVSSTATQTTGTANQATAITFNTIQNSLGLSINQSDSSKIEFSQSGLYTLNFNIQALSNNSSAKNVYFWIRKNGGDIPYSTRIVTVVGNAVYRTLHVAYNVSMQADDYVQLMWATSDTSVELHASPATAFAPTSPSVYVHIDQSAL